MKGERKEEIYLDTSTSQILEMGDSFKYKPTKETKMKCPKCNTEMDYITTECIEIGDEECKGYWECPVCVKKLVLKDVIGGLEELREYPNAIVCTLDHVKGHNQLCNREVELDDSKLDELKDSLTNSMINYDGWINFKKDLKQALSQGKVLKVVK